MGYLANKFYFVGGTCKSTNRIDGKVVIVTGANTGIGYETALELAKRGGKVVLACRDAKRGQDACDKIMLETNSKNVWFERLDLSSFESIREFVARFKSNFTRLDILINNAGEYQADNVNIRFSLTNKYEIHNRTNCFQTFDN